MDEIKIICTPFLLAAIVFCLAMMYYDQNWKKKNPWWQQNDRKMRLSPAETVYRQNERRKLNNALMCWFAVLFMIIGLMIVVLSARIRGNFLNIGSDWFYLVPLVGAIMLAISGIHRRK